MKGMKNDTLFKAQTFKMTPGPKEKQKLRIAWTAQLYFASLTKERKKQTNKQRQQNKMK